MAKKKLKEHRAIVGERADGVKVYKPFYGLSYSEAKEKAADYISSVGYIKKDFAGSEYFFHGWAKRWLLTFKKPYVTENAYYTTYESIVFQHLLPTFGDKLLVDITPEDVQQFYNDKSILSKSMCSKIQMNLNAIFETAIHNDKCYKNPAKFCFLQSQRVANVKEVYDDAQILIAEKWFINRMPEVVLLLETGARRGEMCGWYKSDFDLRKRIYHIRNAVISERGKNLREVPPKAGSIRTNPLSPVAIQAYKTLIQKHPTTHYLLSSDGTNPINPEEWSNKLQTEMRRMSKVYPDVPILTAHELRHTYGTYLRRHGVDIYTIAKVLGHKSINVTSNTYVHNDIGVLKKALKFINKQQELIKNAN